MMFEGKPWEHPNFKSQMLEYLRLYINNIATEFRKNPKHYKELLNNDQITKINLDVYAPPKYPIACPYCGEYKDSAYSVVLKLDDNDIMDKCKKENRVFSAYNTIINGEYLACRAEFTFSCTSNETPRCKIYSFYGHYFTYSRNDTSQTDTYKDLYSNHQCLYDINVDLNNMNKSLIKRN